MLTVQMYPAEFVAMLGFLSRISAGQLDVPLRQQPVTIAVLMAYQSRLSLARIFAWKARRSDRTYKYNLPTFVAVALHGELFKAELSHDQQSLFYQLDQAMVNYKLPLADRLALTTNLLHAATAQFS